ncbi:hypothetical protein H0H92_004445 [Tricholoma furcatifolium]|nr:hypothetical protein H0H92_004445 [Tricholoma furcatifolium]
MDPDPQPERSTPTAGSSIPGGDLQPALGSENPPFLSELSQTALVGINASPESPAVQEQSSSTQRRSPPAILSSELPPPTSPAPAPFIHGQATYTPPSRSEDGAGHPRAVRSRNPVAQVSLSFEEGDVERRHGHPLPPLPHDLRERNNRIGIEGPISPIGPRSGIDYIVPVDEKATREKTVGERLQPTLLTAIAEKNKYALKAKLTGYTLNIAIGIQVLLGALTTGLSAVTAGRQTTVVTAILGGLSTLTASYLARARGSNEPELSITRVKDLEQFIRECEAFQMDHGHTLGSIYDEELVAMRRRFEDLLGNANGNHNKMKNKNKQTKFPVARIKKIMQKDEEVGKVAQATPVVISKALELFLALIVEESSKITTERGSKKVEAYHLKHAVETTEMLDFLKEIVEAVPDPSAGGTIDLEAESAEAAAKKKRGKGKKVNTSGEGEPPKKRRRKKGAEEEAAGDAEPKEEHEKNGQQSRQVLSNYRPRSPSSDDDAYDE